MTAAEIAGYDEIEILHNVAKLVRSTRTLGELYAAYGYRLEVMPRSELSTAVVLWGSGSGYRKAYMPSRPSRQEALYPIVASMIADRLGFHAPWRECRDVTKRIARGIGRTGALRSRASLSCA